MRSFLIQLEPLYRNYIRFFEQCKPIFEHLIEIVYNTLERVFVFALKTDTVSIVLMKGNQQPPTFGARDRWEQ